MASNITPPFKTHPLLTHAGALHGFFGRKGGISTGLYASLNAGYGSADIPTHIVKNRTYIAQAMTISEPGLLSLHQYHSSLVLTVNTPFGTDRPKADGLVTQTPGLALSVLSADCGPILFIDRQSRTIGACHAGWRGALNGIIDNTITAMENLGAKRETIHAVLGPSISQPCYEVGPDFHDQFICENAKYDIFFTPSRHNDRLYFDLKAFCLARLRTAGLIHIAALPDCTYAQPEDYFSYRYNTHHCKTQTTPQDKGGVDYGRNISTIILTE